MGEVVSGGSQGVVEAKRIPAPFFIMWLIFGYCDLGMVRDTVLAWLKKRE